MTKLRFTDSLKSLRDDDTYFRRFVKRGSLTVELYKRHDVDLQKPNECDENYVIGADQCCVASDETPSSS